MAQGSNTEYTKLRNINRGYMKLDVWQKAMDLYRLVHSIISEIRIAFKMRSQIEDAALSIPSNISEGYSRRSIKEYLQLLRLIESLEKKRDAGDWIDHVAEDLSDYNP